MKFFPVFIKIAIFAPHFDNRSYINQFMYAIVNIAGKQFKVTKDQQIYAPKMQGDVDASVEFDEVLFAENDGQVSIGAPLVGGAKVSAKILGHVKGDKIIVFKKKRRKGYKKKKGHRQQYTKIQIEDILL